MNCLIIDDEPLAREGLASYVEQIDFLNLSGMAEDPMAALNLMQKDTPDLLFLDVHMPKMNGLDFIRSLDRPPLIILTTAYPSFALEGYQLDILDYLVKPITFQRFLKASLKAKKQHDLLLQAQQPVSPQAISTTEHFFVKCDGKIEKIGFSELLVVESLQNYVSLHTTRGKFTTLMTLKAISEKLPHHQFYQVHRSFIVQLSQVTTIEGNQLRIADEWVPVSRSRMEEVSKLLLGDDLIN